MKSMMISAEEKKEMMSESIDPPKYPYGLKIHFNEESFEKLGIEDPKVGEKFMILAMAEVCDVHQNKYEGDVPKICMGMQIMEIELKKDGGEKKDIANELYSSKES